MILLKLTALKTLGQGLTDGLLDDPWPGKTNEGVRLSQGDVPQHGKAGRHPAGGGVGEVGDVKAPFLGKPIQGGTGFGHLHEAHDALLHSGTATGTKDDEGKLFSGGVFHGQGDFFTHGGTHAAHHKPSVHDGDHHGYIVRMMAMCAAFVDEQVENMQILIGKMVNVMTVTTPSSKWDFSRCAFSF